MEKIKEEMKKVDLLWVALLIVAAATFLVRILNIAAPIANDPFHPFRTTETAIVVQDFFRNGLSLFHSSMPVFGKPWTCMFEFPTYQAVVYIVMKLFHATNINLWARIISVIIFYFSTYILVRFTKAIINKTAAHCVGIVYLLSAFNLYWSRSVLIDYMSDFFAIAYIYCMYLWLRDSRKKFMYILGLMSGILGYLTKATTMFVVVFFVAFLILENEFGTNLRTNEVGLLQRFVKYVKENIIRLLFLVLLAILPVVAGYMWTNYADAMKDASVYTQWLTSESLHDWNYGTWEQKSQLINWKGIVERVVEMYGGIFAFVGIIAAYLFLSEKKYLKYVVYSLLAQVMTVFALFNLYYIHSYYLIAISPFVYFSYGVMIYEIIKFMTSKIRMGALIAILSVSLLMVAQVMDNGHYIGGVVAISNEEGGSGVFVRKVTDEDELVVVTGENWSPSTLYTANRRGFMSIPGITDIRDESVQQFLREDNYTTLVAHDVDTVNTFLQTYSEMVQFPVEGWGTDYIYKFGQDDLPGDTLKNETKITELDYYDVHEAKNNAIQLECSVPINIGVDTLVKDTDGNVYYCQILLLKDTNQYNINFSEICDEIDSVMIAVGALDEVILRY